MTKRSSTPTTAVKMRYAAVGPNAAATVNRGTTVTPPACNNVMIICFRCGFVDKACVPAAIQEQLNLRVVLKMKRLSNIVDCLGT